MTAPLDTAWQAALAAEHQAVFAYGLLGPRLGAARRSRAESDQAAHAALRDATADAIRASGPEPVAPLADYPRLYPVPDASAALRLARRVEEDCASAWRLLFLRAAATDGTRATGLRRTAQRALVASAVRATAWRAAIDPGHATDPFPGI